MNWLKKLKGVLGLFWHTLFEDYNLIEALNVCYLCIARVADMLYGSLVQRLYVVDLVQANPRLPYVFYVVKDRIDLRTGTRTACIHKEASSIADAVNGVSQLAQDSGTSRHVANFLGSTSSPERITDGFARPSTVLHSGFDYIVKNDQLVFGMDPSIVFKHLVTIQEDAYTLAVCFCLVGWVSRDNPPKDVSVLTDTESLADCAEDVWDMQLHGATLYNTKKLLSNITGAVICSESGVVRHSWIEQGMHHLLINDHIYSARVTDKCNVEHGDNVKTGQVLFGNLRLYTSADKDIPYADVPGMTVTTDAGDVTLLNREDDAVSIDGIKMLPVIAKTPEQLSRYYYRCLTLHKRSDTAHLNIPDKVNAFKFLRDIRGPRGMMAVLGVTDAIKTAEALRHIRRNIDAGSIFNVYVKAVADPLNLSLMHFTASAGNAAVATSATLKIIEATASTHNKL